MFVKPMLCLSIATVQYCWLKEAAGAKSLLPMAEQIHAEKSKTKVYIDR